MRLDATWLAIYKELLDSHQPKAKSLDTFFRSTARQVKPGLKKMKSLILSSLAGIALASSRTGPPSAGCLTVGSAAGKYSTIQSAVDALSTTSASSQCIFITPGVYTENVLVPARTAQLSVYGYTTDTSGYAANKVTITGNKSQALGIGNDETGTLRVKSPNFRLYNVNVNNSYGKGSQAVALSAYADSGYYGCALTGFQDTLLAQIGSQYYKKCLIQGATDFIFGQHAPAWFEECDVRVLTASIGYVTGKLARAWFYVSLACVHCSGSAPPDIRVFVFGCLEGLGCANAFRSIRPCIGD